jgi:hypothetical protein
MSTFSIFAARDGDTYCGTIEATDEDEAHEKARPIIAEALRMEFDEHDPEDFDAELDGFTIEPVPATEALRMTPDLETVLQLAERFVAEGDIADKPEARDAALAAIQAVRGMSAVESAIAQAIREQRVVWAKRQAPGEMNETYEEEEADTVVAVLDDVLRSASMPAAEAAITVAVSMEGGVLQWGGADREGVKLIVIDYDQDGTPCHEIVNMAQPGERAEWACVREENVEINAEAIAHIVEKRAELELREARYAAGECIECGNDLSAPSAAGAEDGVCGECLGSGE